MSECVFCKNLPDLIAKNSPFLVKEFKHSFLLVGEHQTFPGYCVLVLKDHIKELFHLDQDIQAGYQEELIVASQAIEKAYQPNKINVSSYGNMTPHLHWHIFPRKITDKNWPNPPWTLMSEFNKNKTTHEQAQLVREMLLKYL